MEEERPKDASDEASPPADDARDEDGKPLRKFGASARKIDESPGLVRAVQSVRGLLPGEVGSDDPLASDTGRPTLLARYLAAAEERPTTSRELGLAAVQVFQALSDSRSRSKGERELCILFTDLVAFSSWALDAGDAHAVELLREVAGVIEPAITEREGEVVKRLGDGYMAVFTDVEQAVGAAHDAIAGLADVSVAGYEPKLRAGLHVGQPRRVGRDYLGVDVNIAARVADAARGDQLLVTDTARELLDEERFRFRKRRFRAKGAPRELDVFAVSPR